MYKSKSVQKWQNAEASQNGRLETGNLEVPESFLLYECSTGDKKAWVHGKSKKVERARAQKIWN